MEKGPQVVTQPAPHLSNLKQSTTAMSTTTPNDEQKIPAQVHSLPGTPDSPLPSKPPSHLTPYLQILAGHLMVFDTFGFIGSWGVFQAYYETSLSEPRSTISWIGSLQIFLTYFVGTFSGRALDAGYLRTTVGLGCALQVLGIFASASATRYWQLFLSQGICLGLGNGLTFCPMISLISTYFEDRTRALAVSFAAAGAATGGLVFPAIARGLLHKIGIAWTVRVMGFVFLANSAVTLAVVKTRVAARRSGPLVELAAFREVPYSLYALGTFLALWGLYYAYYYISVFAVNVIKLPSDQAFYLIMAINGIGFFGRILPAWLVTRLGDSLRVMIPATILTGVMLFIWAAIHSSAGLFVWVVVYGFFANGVQSLFVGSVGSLTKDKQKMGVRIGMIFTIVSFACLTGPPLAGALIDLHDGEFLYAQIFGGASAICGGLILIAALFSKRKRI